MANGDRMHGAPDQRRDEWHVTVARALGRATRMTALEIEMLGRTMMRVKDSFLPVGPRRRPLPLLLKKLGEVVSRHSERDFVTLQNDPVFWMLIRQIHASQPVARPARPKRRAPKRLAKRATPVAGPEQRGAGEDGGENAPAVDEDGGENTSAASEPAGLEDVVDVSALVGAEIAAVDQGEAGEDAAEAGEAPAGGDAGKALEPGSSDASVDEEETKEQPE